MQAKLVPIASAAKQLPPREVGPAAQLEHHALALANRLQSSLDTSKLMGFFHDELDQLVDHAGIGYRNSIAGIDILLGEQGRYSIDYRLKVQDQDVGTVTMWFAAEPTDEKTGTVETLLCVLVYPLRNSILYREALTRAITDPVTSLRNRAAMDDFLVRETGLAVRHGLPLSVLMIDVDHFKKVNDIHGHLAGDTLLRSIAGSIKDCIRQSDVVFRYGGEEFAVILANTGIDGATLLAERIRKAVATLRTTFETGTVVVTVSIGVASMRGDDDSERLLQRADKALYDAKDMGRNRVTRAPLD